MQSCSPPASRPGSGVEILAACAAPLAVHRRERTSHGPMVLKLRSIEHRTDAAQGVSSSKMSRMRTRILGAPPVALAVALVGCPSGMNELSSLLEEYEELGDGAEQDEDAGQQVEACAFDDPWEPNPSAAQPSLVAWQSVDGWVAHHLIEDAGLCAGEDDWYHYDVESLGYVEHYLYIRGLIEDAGLCGWDCGQPVLSAGPQHAMTVEVYRAHDLQLLSSHTQDDGVLVINGPGGEPYARDLLIRVFSETLAEYSYRLSVEIRNYDGEDECEC